MKMRTMLRAGVTNLVKELGIIRDGVGAGLMEKRPVCIPRYSLTSKISRQLSQNVCTVIRTLLGNLAVTPLHVFNLTNASMHNVKK